MKRKRKIIILIFVIAIFFIILILKFNINKKIIIVGTNTPPFEYYENGELIGIDVDFLKKIMPKLGLEYEIKLMNWEDTLNEMKKNKADIILGAGYTKERESFISYTESQKKGLGNESLWISMDSFYYLKKKNINNFSYRFLENSQLRLGIVNGYFYNDEIWKYNLNFFSYNSLEDLFNGLKNEQVDLIISDKLEAQEIINKINLTKEILEISSPLSINYNYILFSKKYEDKRIKDDFYKELINLKQEKYHEYVYKKYIGENYTEIYKLY